LRSCPETPLPSIAICNPLSRSGRSQRLVAIALVSLVGCVAVGGTGCANMPIQSSGGFGPSGAQVTAAAIGVGAAVVGVAVLVHHSNHTRKGCILSGPSGLEVQLGGESTVLELTGVTANARAGDVYRLHGSMGKKAKSVSGNRTFVVEKVGRDFGPCPVKAPVVASSR
jgi:hypothetical protein